MLARVLARVHFFLPRFFCQSHMPSRIVHRQRVLARVGVYKKREGVLTRYHDNKEDKASPTLTNRFYAIVVRICYLRWCWFDPTPLSPEVTIQMEWPAQFFLSNFFGKFDGIRSILGVRFLICVGFLLRSNNTTKLWNEPLYFIIGNPIPSNSPTVFAQELPV